MLASQLKELNTMEMSNIWSGGTVTLHLINFKDLTRIDALRVHTKSKRATAQYFLTLSTSA